jgi:hypothetical protein
MEKKYFLYFLLFIGGLCPFLASCSLFNPPVVVPCYGHIDSIPLIITNTAKQGTSSNGINSVWVYLDDNPVGAFQMPVTFPMIATTGSHIITIFAGVSDYGDQGNRLKYPFYSSYSITTKLTQGAVTTFKPTTSYTSYAQFGNNNDNFDAELQPSIVSTGTVVAAIAHSDTSMFIIKSPNPNVFQGTGSGEVYLDGVTHQNYCGVMQDSIYIPTSEASNPVFLEINYKSNCVFGVGMYNTYTSTPTLILYVDTTNTWKKMYINLQPTISGSPTLAPPYGGYYIYFQMTNTSGTPTEFYIDNVKLVREN